MAFVNVFYYLTAVRGCHYYRNYWQPQPEQTEYSVQHFCYQSYCWHLPMENLHITNKILDRGARVYVILTFAKYCLLPLVQDGSDGSM